MTSAPLPPPVRPSDEMPGRKVLPSSTDSPSQNQKPRVKQELSKQTSSARLPPPSLFQGPPSRNASNISLHLPGVAAAAVGLPLAASLTPTRSSEHLQRISSRRRPDPKNGDPSPGGGVGPKVGTASALSRYAPDVNAQRENDRADALWAEMQNTLAEVEVSAANSSHIFGAGHAKALEELRAAQLALAKAWAKGEADEVGSHAARDGAEEVMPMDAGAASLGSKEKDGKNGTNKQQQQQQQQQQPGLAESNGSERARKTLEEETENDILLAKSRREANDRYFEHVNNAVLDVVKRLDEVAGAMRRVEKESNDIWSEEEGETETEANSVTASTTGG